MMQQTGPSPSHVPEQSLLVLHCVVLIGVYSQYETAVVPDGQAVNPFVVAAIPKLE
jgi:hypothetical protein